MKLCLHIDMDCFYAAVEERENPYLRGKPVAVGGNGRRSVICTANYEARKYGCRSAMPNYKALELCPQLIIVPLQFDLYRQTSEQIRNIFKRHTDVIEPLSLDEAYLDLGDYRDEGSLIAQEIRSQIWNELNLTCSAGIAPNKMLAKIASDWEKPNGQFEIKVGEIEAFMQDLPVSKLHGVGKRTQERLSRLEVDTCGKLQRLDRFKLTQHFGKWGAELYDLCRGIDQRNVEPNRTRKSISKETTFPYDISDPEALVEVQHQMQGEIQSLLETKYKDRKVKSLVVKLTFSDFKHTSAECIFSHQDKRIYQELLGKAWERGEGKSIRLFGIGVKLADEEKTKQMELF